MEYFRELHINLRWTAKGSISETQVLHLAPLNRALTIWMPRTAAFDARCPPAALCPALRLTGCQWIAAWEWLWSPSPREPRMRCWARSVNAQLQLVGSSQFMSAVLREDCASSVVKNKFLHVWVMLCVCVCVCACVQHPCGWGSVRLQTSRLRAHLSGVVNQFEGLRLLQRQWRRMHNGAFAYVQLMCVYPLEVNFNQTPALLSKPKAPT